MNLTTPHICDFCSDQIKQDDTSAMIYQADSFESVKFGFASEGAWLACNQCVSFIRQYDSGNDPKAKDNLSRRALEKLRRKYDMRGASATELNQLLLKEVQKLHSAFWLYRKDTAPVPYSIKRLEEA